MRTEKKFQYKLTDFFFSVLMNISKNQWRSTGGKSSHTSGRQLGSTFDPNDDL